MGNVVHFTGETRLDLEPNRVLDVAKEQELSGVVVLGIDSEGEEYFATSYANALNILWLLRRTEHVLMQNLKGEGE